MNNRLEKLFRILGSSNEHEAMSALRAIISLKTKNGQTWNQFVDALVKVGFGENLDSRWKSARSDYSKVQVDPNTTYKYYYSGFTHSSSFASWTTQNMEKAQQERNMRQQAESLRNAFMQREAEREYQEKLNNAVRSDPVASKVQEKIRPREPSKKWFGGFDFSKK